MRLIRRAMQAMPGAMPRRLFTVLLLVGLAPVIWLREPVLPNDTQSVSAVSLPLTRDQAGLGPFRLTGAWDLSSPNRDFGGYSALVVSGPGRLSAFSDFGVRLDLPMPGQPGAVRIARLLPKYAGVKSSRDVEAAALDQDGVAVWLTLERRNTFMRTAPGQAKPEVFAAPELAGWPENSGPEAMTRLRDGRFLVIAEAGGPAHQGRLLPHAPDGTDRSWHFRYLAPAGYRPTDVAQLPDGRVLILLRELRWPMPPRFGTKLVLADPATIRRGQDWGGTMLASLDGTGLEENYEGLAIEPGPDGTLNAWLISDNNNAATQRTLLLRLQFRLSDLPPRGSQAKQKAPG
ncbi:esterase-like activity of phytase family protein [Novosphingobium ginsenosidimutans]|nr:esterase-like activity of phytase family protein [Novosphingobium ginsenosidimutans]